VNFVDWLILVGRVVAVFLLLLISVMIVIWYERKLVADMQTRIGPNRAGPAGILISIADGIKLFFKEGVTPTQADRPVYVMAPVIQLVPAFLAFAVIPFGTGVTIAGRAVPFQIADLNVGVLWILAMSSLAVYGIVLAGWSSGSNYPLLGSIRSSAQMISYEVVMSLGLIAVLMYSGTLSMSGIVEFQARHFEGDLFGFIPVGWMARWNIIAQFPAFVIFMVAGLAETNRHPFDLPEAESELVAGYNTEYSGIKFAMFFLAEYLHMITIAAVAVTLFLGGWHGPRFDVVPWLWPIVWFLVKLYVILFLFMWIRATLPRFRYDRLMRLGWKVGIPLGLFWVMATAAIVVLPDVYGPNAFRVGLWIIGGLLLLFWIAPVFTPKPAPADSASDAGGTR
jgi:NADH-quinone oxidoreductase subunit H